MKRFASGLHAVVPLAVTVAMLSTSSAIAQDCVMDPGKSKPFKASFEFSEQFAGIGSTCPVMPTALYATTATGQATHLGRATLSSTNCVYPNLPMLVFIGPAVTITAANGDQLWATYEGQANPALKTSTGLFDLKGRFKIVGGTGRFQGAQGCGDLSGSEQISSPEPTLGNFPATGVGHIELNGIISYGSKNQDRVDSDD